MDHPPSTNQRFRVNKKMLYTLLAFSFVLVSIYAYNYVQPYIGVPKRPADFEVVFRYGVRARNVLNTSSGTYTKDMIGGDDVTLRFRLSNHELDIIWAQIYRNKFYEMDEQLATKWDYGPSHYDSYILSVQAEGYPDKKVRLDFSGMGPHSEYTAPFKNITEKVKSIIHSKPVIWFLPKPTGGYA